VSTKLAAIDLQPSVARIMQIDSTLRTAEITGFSRIEAREDEETLDFWKRVRASLPPSVDSFAVTADPTQLSTRVLSFPFGDLKKIEQAVEFELEGQVPYDLDDMMTTFEVFERSQTQSSVLCSIVSSAHLEERIELLAEADLEARAVVHPSAAFAELVKTPPDETVAVLSFDESCTHLAILRSGLRFARTLRTGSVQLERALADRFKLTKEQARKAREDEAQILPAQDEADDAARRISDAVVAGLTPLMASLTTTFKSLPVDDHPSRLVITGVLSELPGLAEHMSGRLGIPVDRLDLDKAVTPIPCGQVIDPEYAVAAGIGLGLLRRGRSMPLNFRRGRFAYSGDLQLYRSEFIRIAIGVAAVFALALIGSMVRYSLITSEESRLDEGFCKATEKIVGRQICDMTAALATMRQTPGAAVGGLDVPTFSAADVYEMMSKAIGREVDVEFKELDFRLEIGGAARVSGKGETSSFEATEKIQSALKKDKCVTKAEVSKQRKTRNSNRVEFNLNVDLKCPAGVIPGAGFAELARAAVPVDGGSGGSRPTRSADAPDEAPEEASGIDREALRRQKQRGVRTLQPHLQGGEDEKPTIRRTPLREVNPLPGRGGRERLPLNTPRIPGRLRKMPKMMEMKPLKKEEG